jgi:hypothetical protein
VTMRRVGVSGHRCVEDLGNAGNRRTPGTDDRQQPVAST